MHSIFSSQQNKDTENITNCTLNFSESNLLRIPLTVALNFISVIILTVNDIINVFILLRRKFIQFIEEVT